MLKIEVIFDGSLQGLSLIRKKFRQKLLMFLQKNTSNLHLLRKFFNFLDMFLSPNKCGIGACLQETMVRDQRGGGKRIGLTLIGSRCKLFFQNWDI
jgi:hypothetical protein